jgi:hypothetical protein
MPISWSRTTSHFEFLRMPTSVTPGLMNASGVLENWIGDFEYMRRTEEWGILTYTCHPYVIGRGHRMLMLERLLDALVERNALLTSRRWRGIRWLPSPGPMNRDARLHGVAGPPVPE